MELHRHQPPTLFDVCVAAIIEHLLHTPHTEATPITADPLYQLPQEVLQRVILYMRRTNNITDNTLHILLLQRLKEDALQHSLLDLTHARITRAGFNMVCQYCTNIQQLELVSSTVDAISVGSLCKAMPDLQELNITGCSNLDFEGIWKQLEGDDDALSSIRVFRAAVLWRWNDMSLTVSQETI